MASAGRMSTTIAWGYARISKDDSLEGRGVARQTEDIEAVCARHGWHLDRMLVDNDISASRFSKAARPGYGHLLEAIANGTVNRAVVYDLDRLLRQPRQLEDLIDLVETRPTVEIHSVTGKLDLTSGAGRFTARAMVAVAAMESDNASRRLRRAFEQKAKEGGAHGPRPFGYETDGVTPRKSEGDLIREAAAAVLNGSSLTSIARIWNQAGVTPPQRATEWTATTVRTVLTNPRQAGMRFYRGSLVNAAAWEGNLTRQTHGLLIAHLNKPLARRPALRSNPFGGLVTDVHGVPLDRDMVKGRPAYRGRRRPGREAQQVSIAAEPLERYVVQAVSLALDDQLFTAKLEERRERQTELPDLNELEEQLELLAEDFGNGRISRREWLAAREPIMSRLDDGRQAILADATTERVQPEIDLLTRWSDLSILDQATILRSVLDGVLIQPAASRGGPQPLVHGLGRIDLDRVVLRWLV